MQITDGDNLYHIKADDPECSIECVIRQNIAIAEKDLEDRKRVIGVYIAALDHIVKNKDDRIIAIKAAFKTIEELTKADLANYPPWYKLREEATK